MPKVSPELLGFKIQKFEPDPKLCLKFVVFILFCKVTSGCKNVWVVPKSYIMLCNNCGRFLIMLPSWVALLVKVDGIEKFKMGRCCMDCIELRNRTF